MAPRPRNSGKSRDSAGKGLSTNEINRSTVIVKLKDVHNEPIQGQAMLKFYNQRSPGLSQQFDIRLPAQSRIERVPAFPFGLAQVFITPTKYRHKSIFINVPAGKPGLIEETCFVEPSKVKAVFPTFATISHKPQLNALWNLMQRSGIDEDVWNRFDDPQKACLFNIVAKLQREVVDSGEPVIKFVDKILELRPSRIFAAVRPELYDSCNGCRSVFRLVSGALHKLGDGWKRIGSFKTFDAAGNLQLTFAKKVDDWKADIDLDDHKGVQHAADVLKHKITDKDTHPYDIHQILVYFQGLYPGYTLV
jgi:hypothetical protein